MEERASFWRAPELGSAELLKARFRHHFYPPHAHDTVCLAVITGGAFRVGARGRGAIVRRGEMVVINADEVHEGGPVDEAGWRMRTLHVTPAALAGALDPEQRPFALDGPHIVDNIAARALYGVHWCSETGGAPLKRQTRFVALAARLFQRHGERRASLPAVAQESLPVARAREYLVEHLAERVTLDQIAAVAGLPPFRFLRAFARATGIPPHAWVTQERVRAAMRLLRAGEPVAEIAAATGFSDQAHLTRVFKHFVGVTPGRFRAA
jgi:AraC-like DNA-binding protein